METNSVDIQDVDDYLFKMLDILNNDGKFQQLDENDFLIRWLAINMYGFMRIEEYHIRNVYKFLLACSSK